MPDPIELAQNPGDGNVKAPTISDEARNALLTQYQLSQQIKKAERANPNAIDLVGEAGYSALHSGIQSPITSLGQIADNLLGKADIKTNIAGTLTKMPAPEHEESGTARWHAQQIGGAGGMVLPPRFDNSQSVPVRGAAANRGAHDSRGNRRFTLVTITVGSLPGPSTLGLRVTRPSISAITAAPGAERSAMYIRSRSRLACSPATGQRCPVEHSTKLAASAR